MPSVMVFGSEVLGSCLGTESRALKNGISVLIKKDPAEIPGSLCYVETRPEGTC